METMISNMHFSFTLLKPLDHFTWWNGTEESKNIYLGQDANCNISTGLDTKKRNNLELFIIFFRGRCSRASQVMYENLLQVIYLPAHVWIKWCPFYQRRLQEDSREDFFSSCIYTKVKEYLSRVWFLLGRSCFWKKSVLWLSSVISTEIAIQGRLRTRIFNTLWICQAPGNLLNTESH